jgi:hypothetical protein
MECLKSLEQAVTFGAAQFGEVTSHELSEDPDFVILQKSTDPEIARRWAKLLSSVPAQ